MRLPVYTQWCTSVEWTTAFDVRCHVSDLLCATARSSRAVSGVLACTTMRCSGAHLLRLRGMGLSTALTVAAAAVAADAVPAAATAADAVTVGLLLLLLMLLRLLLLLLLLLLL